jgi:Family of unknown function (DUF6151)
MDFPIRCRCGQLEGQLTFTERAGRAVCYCRDCQAFARFLGNSERILNELAGTDIIATSPRFLRIARGKEQLRCMSLSEKGLLRWYTACCRTAIGNTPRNPKLSYVGLVHSCLAGSSIELDAAFGPAKAAINTASANGTVNSTSWSTFRASLKIMRNVLGSRLSGKYRDNPFFMPGTAEPLVAPQVLTVTERRVLRGDA